jgi:hypothetical protein
MTPRRLGLHLEIAQVLGASVPQYRLQSSRTGVTDSMLETLEAHMREVGVR